MSEREAFSRWVDVTTEAWTTDERKGGTPRKAEVSLCAGIMARDDDLWLVAPASPAEQATLDGVDDNPGEP